MTENDIDKLELKEGKTQELVKLLTKIDAKGNTLVVVDTIGDKLKRAASNISDVKVIQPKYLNVARILDADCLIIGSQAIATIEDWLDVPAKKEAK